MSIVENISQTASNALILLRILCFCNSENISINILKQKCDALYQKEKNDILITSAINKLETIINLFRFLIHFFKVIQEIQRASFVIYTLKRFERVIRIYDLMQLLLQSKLIITAERKQ